jgi:YHS domain-containing protein
LRKACWTSTSPPWEQLKEQFVLDPIARIRFPQYLASSTLERDGRTYYFVDEETRREFEKRPAGQ